MMNKVFEDIISAITNIGASTGNCEYDRGHDEALSQAIVVAETVISKHNNGWIPTSERLPKSGNEQYLTQNSIGAIQLLNFYCGWNCLRGINSSVNCKHEITDIVAWQPLPEPYKVSEVAE